MRRWLLQPACTSKHRQRCLPAPCQHLCTCMSACIRGLQMLTRRSGSRCRCNGMPEYGHPAVGPSPPALLPASHRALAARMPRHRCDCSTGAACHHRWPETCRQPYNMLCNAGVHNTTASSRPQPVVRHRTGAALHLRDLHQALPCVWHQLGTGQRHASSTESDVAHAGKAPWARCQSFGKCVGCGQQLSAAVSRILATVRSFCGH